MGLKEKLLLIIAMCLVSLLVTKTSYADTTTTEDGWLVEDGEIIGTPGYNPDFVMPAYVFPEDNRIRIDYNKMNYPFSAIAYIRVDFTKDPDIFDKHHIEYNDKIKTYLGGHGTGTLVGPDSVLTCGHLYELAVNTEKVNGKLHMKPDLSANIEEVNIGDTTGLSEDEAYSKKLDKFIKENLGITDETEYKELYTYLTPYKKNIKGVYIDLELIEKVQINFKYDYDYLKSRDTSDKIANMIWANKNSFEIKNPTKIIGKTYESDNDSLSEGDVFITKEYLHDRTYDFLLRRVADYAPNTDYLAQGDISCIRLPKKIGNELGWLGIRNMSIVKKSPKLDGYAVGFPSDIATLEGDPDDWSFISSQKVYVKNGGMFIDTGHFYRLDNFSNIDSFVTNDIDLYKGQSGGPAVIRVNGANQVDGSERLWHVIVGIVSRDKLVQKYEAGKWVDDPENSYNYFAGFNSNTIQQLYINNLIPINGISGGSEGKQ